MTRIQAVLFWMVCLSLAGCGPGAATGLGDSKWQEEGQGHEWQIEFAADGRFIVHGDGPDHSSHDHCRGTWAADQGGAKDAFQLTGRWDHARKDVAWRATLRNERLQLDTGPGEPTRVFRRQ